MSRGNWQSYTSGPGSRGRCPSRGGAHNNAAQFSTDLSQHLQREVEEKEEKVCQAEAGEEEPGVVGGPALPATHTEGEGDGCVTGHSNLDRSASVRRIITV